MRRICAFFAVVGMTALLAGCGSPKPKTPGEKLDDAINKTGDAVKDAGDKIKKEAK